MVADAIRRVVTGLDEHEKAVVVLDSHIPLAARSPGVASANLWISESYPPGLSNKDTASRQIGISPPDNGTVFRIVEFAPTDPAAEAHMPHDMLMKRVGPSPAKGLPAKHPMMHRTRTLDYALILSGEIDMMLDDTSLHLKAGDAIVQQATNHAWINHGTQPCRILFVLMDSQEP
jgi:mannose-6-phosphate isomerase-like protein (cupin superfamily)